jgi:putative tryptophan/tyrosine transport system substrate-binding protein
VVFVGGGDAVDANDVNSAARSPSNMTGFTNVFSSMGGKWLELFKEAVPRLTRVADVYSANELANPQNELRSAIDAAATRLGVKIVKMPLRNPEEIERAISAFASEPDGGILLTGASPAVFVEATRQLALHYHLPLMRGGGAGSQEGILMSHGPDLADLARRSLSYVDRILRGAKPSELQYPTKFELVVNLKTAKAIGLIIPESFLLRADEVIE